MKRLIIFFRFFGDLNYYKRVDKLSLLDWLWRRRISAKTAWELAKIIAKPIKK